MAITITHKHFDVLEFVKKAKESGIKEEFAEYSAKQIEQLSETIQEQNTKIQVLGSQEPATKKDLEVIKLELQKEIKEVELNLRKEIESSKIWTLVIFSSGWVSMLAIVAKGFHWW